MQKHISCHVLSFNEVEQDVTLLNYTKEPDKTVAMAARLCYSKMDFTDLDETLTPEKVVNLVCKLADMGHYSPFEHVSFTFGISNISRVASHQLVRHRVASYSQQSHRYTKSEGAMIIPAYQLGAVSKEAEQVFQHLYETSMEAYETLLNMGVAAENARYALPQATTSNIIVTMNARELINFFKLRCCMRAQDEIRVIAKCMLLLCREVAPVIFKKAGPPCASGECSEGEHKAEACKEGRKHGKREIQ